jgi:8-oxo-dGTP pyrophosphatase MutT (NUDIX family)
MPKKSEAPRRADRPPRAQAAALPWRRGTAGDVEVLLITSRETHRWVIPKGWPIKGLSAAQTAAREAFEEAGVEGEIAGDELGVYHYDKRLRSGRVRKVRVAVYPLKVEVERNAWPEARQREKRWATPAVAAQLVQEPELAGLFRTFAPR